MSSTGNSNRTGNATSIRSPALPKWRRADGPDFDFSRIQNTGNRDSEAEEITPLMDNDKNKVKPSLATPESDEIDDKEIATKPYPGVDDGFFADRTLNERVPPMENHQAGEVPPREESDDKMDLPKDADFPDGVSYRGGSRRPSIPTEHEFGLHDGHHHQHDMEVGSTFGLESVDLNVYQHKKTLAQGMMDLALFSANANQLRYVLESASRHPYYYPSLVFIVSSLILQVAIGIGLIWNATYNVKDEKEVCVANRINNFTVIGIFLVTVVNVFISAFGVADQPVIPNIIVPTNAT